ncbi:MAG: DUF3148 domain-containing protein [Cyanobacteria bacterium P01_A01_bin.123]
MSESFKSGDRVRLIGNPPYIKTADSMPMLRPPDVVASGEEGTVIDQRPGGYFGVRFSRGSFLLDSQYLELAQNLSQEENSIETHIDIDQQQ